MKKKKTDELKHVAGSYKTTKKSLVANDERARYCVNESTKITLTEIK